MDVSPRPPNPGREHGYEVEWTTISYRTITLFVVLALILIGVVAYLLAPNWVGKKARQVIAAITESIGQTTGSSSGTTKREAHFVNIDGTVRVRKSPSLQWTKADYNIGLAKGDFVQTGSDGNARIIFADGTNYVLKPDSLIVVEESREDPVTKATKVAVQVSSGAVDLSTGRFEVPGSTSQVSFENAVANLSEESRALVRNDPNKNVHEFTMNQGRAEIKRDSSSVQLGQYDRVSFSAEKPGLVAGERELLPQHGERHQARRASTFIERRAASLKNSPRFPPMRNPRFRDFVKKSKLFARDGCGNGCML